MISLDTRYCPDCGADWQGNPIPPENQIHYGKNTHFSRLIGLSDPGKDRVVAWVCPDCGADWLRD